MRYLRKNTAVIVTVGPFYDKTTGVDIEGSLTITNEKITLVADTDDGNAPTIILDNVTGATSGTDNDLNYITNCDAGLMQLELTAANTNRVGRMLLTVTDAANHVPVFHEFMVLDGAVYDSLVLGTDKLAVDTQEISSDATAADNAESFFDGTGYAGTNNVIPTVTTLTGHTAQTGDSYAVVAHADYGNAKLVRSTTPANTLTVDASHQALALTNAVTNDAITAAAIANGAIDAATFAAGAITAAAIATNAIDADALAADGLAEIADAVWDEALAGHAGAGTAGDIIGNLVTDIGALTPAVAISTTTAASVSTGALAVRTYHSLSQAISSTYAGDLSAATKLWLAVKAEKDDTDAQAVIFIEKTAGLTVLAGAAYTTVAHGSLTVGGLAGAWTVTVALDEVATGLLTAYADGMLWAECKALVAGTTVAVWDGVCDVSRGIVNAVA